MKAASLTRERLMAILSYDPGTGLFTWIAPPKEHPRMKGQVAGATATGYVEIRIDRVRYKAHHLAWLHVHSSWPTRELDHKDRDTFNNRIANLRLASNAQNQANKGRIAGKALPKGVRVMPSGRYQARIRIQDRLMCLGTFPSAQEASDVYLKAARTHYGEFARAD